MSKRKAIAGGYEESSDDVHLDLTDSPERPTKKAQPVAYAPPRLSTATKQGLGPFQLPGAVALGRTSIPAGRHLSLPSISSRRQTPATESARNTPEIQVCECWFTKLNLLSHLDHGSE